MKDWNKYDLNLIEALTLQLGITEEQAKDLIDNKLLGVCDTDNINIEGLEVYSDGLVYVFRVEKEAVGMFKLNEVLKSKTEKDIYNYIEQLRDNLNDCYNLSDFYREAEDLGRGIFQVDLFIRDVFNNTIARIELYYKKSGAAAAVYNFKFNLNIIENFE